MQRFPSLRTFCRRANAVVWQCGILVAVFASSLLAAGRAHAANELCGQTITESLTLTADQACTGQGLIVGADGVTIDLGGFTLSGDGGTDEFGIDVNGHGNVTIVNGTVAGFFDGIVSRTGYPPKLELSRLVVRDCVRKGAGVSASTLSIDKSAFINNGSPAVPGSSGIEFGCDRGKITSTAVVANGGDGLSFFGASKVTVAKVVSALNHGRGAALYDGDDAAIKSSTFARNGGDGIGAFGYGVDRVKVTKSVIVGNTYLGVTLFRVTDGVVSGNVIAANAGGGVSIDSSTRALVAGNRLLGNGFDGVTVGDSLDTVVKGNTAVGSADDGFSITSDSTVVAKNVANGNRALGFFVPVAVVDGGGNTARANGSPAQCSAPIACPPTFVAKAGPVMPTCGMHVTTSIKLGADTPLCMGTDGIIVDADGVTIDLNGHRIGGNRSGGTTGIAVQDHDKVTIKNGVVAGFETGISSSFGKGLKLQNVESRDHVLFGATLGGDGISVSKSAFISNSGTGLFFFDATTAPKVSASFFVGNSAAGLVSRAPGTTLSKLTSTRNGGNGIQLESTGSGGVSASIVAGNTDGIHVDGPFAPTAITKNVVVGNGMDGIDLTTAAVNVTIASNLAGGNGQHGLHIGALDRDTVARNVLIANGFDGMLIEPAAGFTPVVANTAIGNANTGLAVSTAAARLAKNLARANLGIGIAATAGDADDGGNQARDNAGVAQCTGPIVCD